MGGDDDINGGSEARVPATQPLHALLAAYGREINALRKGWDTESYRIATELFAQVRAAAATRGDTRTAWVEFLITRFEFAQVLWDTRTRPDATPALHEAHEKHAAAVRRLLAAAGPGTDGTRPGQVR